MEENKEIQEVEHQYLRPRNEQEVKMVEIVENIIDYYVSHHYTSRFEIIKAKHLFSWDERMRVRKSLKNDKLNVHRHWLTDSVHDAFTKELINQNYTPKMIPLHPSKRKVTQDAQDAYDWMYNRSRFETNVSEKAYSEAALLWDSYVFFWKEKSWEYEIPTSEHISFFEMFIEPMATDFDSSRTKIIRKIVDTSDVVWKYWTIINRDEISDITEEWLTNEEILNETVEWAIYKTDFTKLRDIAFYENSYLENIQECCNWVDGPDQRRAIENYFETWEGYEDLFGISEWSKLCEVIEIREKCKWWYNVQIMINGYIFPTKNWLFVDYDPFGNIYFEESPWSPIHRGIWHKLLPRQREADLLLFSLNNAIKMHVFPDFISDGWVEDADWNQVTSMSWSWEQRVYKPKKEAMAWRQPFQPIEYVSKDVLNLVRIRLGEVVQWAYQEVGINSYILWWDWRVERVSWAFQERIDQSRARLKTIKKTISQSLNKSYYLWLNILDWKFWEKLLERIDNDDKSTFQDLDLESISNNFEVIISSEWHREDTLRDMGQNVLNVVNGMGQLINEPQADWTIIKRYDERKFAHALADKYGLEWLEIYDDKQEVENYRKELEKQLQKAIIENEYAEKFRELQPQQQTPLEAPNNQALQDQPVITDERWQIIQPQAQPQGFPAQG